MTVLLVLHLQYYDYHLKKSIQCLHSNVEGAPKGREIHKRRRRRRRKGGGKSCIMNSISVRLTRNLCTIQFPWWAWCNLIKSESMILGITTTSQQKFLHFPPALSMDAVLAALQTAANDFPVWWGQSDFTVDSHLTPTHSSQGGFKSSLPKIDAIWVSNFKELELHLYITYATANIVYKMHTLRCFIFERATL